MSFIVTNRQILDAINQLDLTLHQLHIKADLIMSEQSQVDADVQAEEASITAISGAVANIAAEIAALKAGNPAVNFAGLDAAVTDLGNATASVQGLETPPA